MSTDEIITRNVTVSRLRRYAFGATTASMGVVLLAACSGGGDSPTHASIKGLKTESTSVGTVAANSSGRTLYELVGNTAASSKCTGSCLSTWPATLSHAKQVVLQGHPAFTFAGDSAAGQVNGQGVRDTWGTWYALDSAGKPITAKPGSTGGSSSGSGGGYGGY